MEIVRTQKEIEVQLRECLEAETEGSKYPGLTYEEGIKALYAWLIGETENYPL